MSKLVFGVGINDADYNISLYKESKRPDGKRYQIEVWKCPFYVRWKNMLERCYNEPYLKTRPTYVGCSVCEDWLSFSVFRAWMITQDWEGKQLDKDILFSDNKIYSPETCVFVDPIVNTFVRDTSRGDWPVGVSLTQSGKYKAACRSVITGKNEPLGNYSTPEEAHIVWLAYKTEQAYILADRQSDERVAKALIERYENYKAA